MSNITAIPWEARGVSLHQHSWAVKTFGGGRYAPPEKRGEDVQVPHRNGRVPTKKYRDAKVFPLPMWIQPCNTDGSTDLTMSQEAKMHSNWQYLRDLFDTEGQFELTKRWYGPDGSILVATGMAELLEAPEPNVIAQDTLDVTFTLTMADPYFYAPAVMEAIGTLDVIGDAEDNDHLSILMGAGDRFTGHDGNWIQYNGASAVEINVHDRTALAGTTYVNGLITRNLDFQSWPTLKPGTNNLVGAGTIIYNPAYK